MLKYSLEIPSNVILVLEQLQDVIELKAIKNFGKDKIEEMEVQESVKEYVAETESLILIL